MWSLRGLFSQNSCFDFTGVSFFWLLSLPIVAFVGVFIFLAIKNPRALQSEHLQITMRQMDLAVASKGQAPAIAMDDNETNAVEGGGGNGQPEIEPTRSIENTVKEA